MKQATIRSSKQTTKKPIQEASHGNNHKPRPEIRDDMDGRSHKEQGYRGDKSKKGDKKKTGA